MSLRRRAPAVLTGAAHSTVFVVALATAFGVGVAKATQLTLLLTGAGLATLWAFVSLPSFLVAVVPVSVLASTTAAFHISLPLLLVAIAALAWVFGLGTGRWALVPRWHLLVAAFAGWLILRQVVIPPLGGLSTSACPYTICPSGPSSPSRDLLQLLAGLVLCAIAMSTLVHKGALAKTMVLTAAIAAVLAQQGAPASRPGSSRAMALNLNPNYFGTLLALGLVAGVAVLLRTRNPLWIAPAVIVLLVDIGTRSRGALLATAGGCAVMLVVGQRRRTQVLVAGALLAVVMLLPATTASVWSSATAGRSRIELDYNTSIRAKAAIRAIGLTEEHALIGVGYGLFPAAAAADSRVGVYMNTHNDFLRLSSETGAASLALFTLLLIGAAVAADRRWGEQAVIVTFGIALLFGNFLSNLAIAAPAWVLMGVSIGDRARRGFGGGAEMPSDDAPDVVTTCA